MALSGGAVIGSLMGFSGPQRELVIRDEPTVRGPGSTDEVGRMSVIPAWATLSRSIAELFGDRANLASYAGCDPTDAKAPAWNAALRGGGASHVGARCDGTAWVAF